MHVNPVVERTTHAVAVDRSICIIFVSISWELYDCVPYIMHMDPFNNYAKGCIQETQTDCFDNYRNLLAVYSLVVDIASLFPALYKIKFIRSCISVPLFPYAC